MKVGKRGRKNREKCGEDERERERGTRRAHKPRERRQNGIGRLGR